VLGQLPASHRPDLAGQLVAYPSSDGPWSSSHADQYAGRTER
jgi:hypothetical protein